MLYYRIIVVSILLSLISGCQLTAPKSNTIPVVVNNDKIAVVEQPPKLLTTDWQVILSPLMDELLETTDIGNDNQLLVSDVKNMSNSYVSSTQINKIILNLLNQQSIFNVLDKATINQAKLALGIPYDDSLISRSKMIALARNIKADYVLFTTITQIPKAPDTKAGVAMELLLVKTGEIVWQFSSNQLIDTQVNN